MKKLRIFANVVLLSLCSCSSTVDPIEEKTEESTAESFNLTIKYDGKTYDVPCVFKNDSLTYLDESFNKLYVSEIASNPNLAAIAYKGAKGEDIIEYYASRSDLEEECGIEDVATNVGELSRATVEPKAGRAILYDDSNFSDSEVTLDIDYDLFIAIPSLKNSHGFNDKTSSIRVFNFLDTSKYYIPSYLKYDEPIKGENLRTCLMGYEDTNYSGKVLYCIASYVSGQNIKDPSTASHADYKLKRIGWNDKISSVVFRIVTLSYLSENEIVAHDPN
jgi:hypothetical protein